MTLSRSSEIFGSQALVLEHGQHIYQRYRTMPGTFRLRNAHNDYLELLTNGGIIAFLFAAWFFISFFFKSYKAFRKRRESYSICLYLGSIAGIVAILIHSNGDWILFRTAQMGSIFSFFSVWPFQRPTLDQERVSARQSFER